MRLPHQFTDNVAFVAGGADELLSALAGSCSENERDEIQRLCQANLPPVTSQNALAVMAGFNPGFIWSILSSPNKHYRVFNIPKGRNKRQIEAPRVALKMVQKWLSVHFERSWTAHEAVHGFVKGRSHISAASYHLGAEWVVSVDIANFFPSTSAVEVREALIQIGYQSDASLDTLTKLCCFEGRLSQGAPTSPILSNIALHPQDEAISLLANKFEARFTRYADDIVLSGYGHAPKELFGELETVFEETPWIISAHKRHVAELPRRLKVHGLLVHGDRLRLTKGYRNKIRAFAHLLSNDKISKHDMNRIKGHLNYASQVDRQSDQ